MHCSKFSDVAKQAFIFYALSGIIARTVSQYGLRGKIQGQTILLQSFIAISMYQWGQTRLIVN